jgi:hypothetical protein
VADRGSHPAQGAINRRTDWKWKTEKRNVATPIDSPFEVD